MSIKTEYFAGGCYFLNLPNIFKGENYSREEIICGITVI